jgi:hypothetical protein
MHTEGWERGEEEGYLMYFKRFGYKNAKKHEIKGPPPPSGIKKSIPD